MREYVTEKLKNEFNIEYYSGEGYPQDRCFLHAHPFHEFQLIGAGDVTYTTSDFIERVNNEKCFIFSHSYRLHNPYINQKVQHERYQVEFIPELLSSLIMEYAHLFDPLISTSGIWRISDPVYEQMRSIMETLLSIYSSGNMSKNAILQYRLLTGTLMSIAAQAVKTSFTTNPPVLPSYIGTIVKYIQEHFHENITTEKMSSMFFVSATKLNADFKREVGMTIRTFITLTRIDAAKQLLRRGYAVSSVADMCGYAGNSYFIRVFREYTQLTPLKYQKKVLMDDGSGNIVE